MPRYSFKREDHVIAIYENEKRIGSYNLKTRKLTIVFSGHAKELAILIRSLIDFITGGHGVMYVDTGLPPGATY